LSKVRLTEADLTKLIIAEDLDPLWEALMSAVPASALDVDILTVFDTRSRSWPSTSTSLPRGAPSGRIARGCAMPAAGHGYAR